MHTFASFQGSLGAPPSPDGSWAALCAYNGQLVDQVIVLVEAHQTAGAPCYANIAGPHLRQYGGYCAYGVAQNKLVSIEPDKFKIIDGKLYLNYDGDVQQKWLLDTAGYVKTADAKFPGLIKK